MDLWRAESWYSPAEASWGKIAGNLASDLLSMKLTLSSKELTYAHRYEEAYWLLVESLEENADNREALELMNRFPKRSKKKNRAIVYSIAAGGVVTALMIAFLIGRKTRDGFEPEMFSGKGDFREILSIGNESALLPLKEDSLSYRHALRMAIN